ncbi:MAG TPA: 50S ribosomal protein L29 [Thermomicrobiales bacterium]|nr:50S ribosomal protein L29 [Thermomicrobiales bacterium]
MKPVEIRALNDAELDDQVRTLKTEWRELRFQEAVGQLTATTRIRQIRKDIARIHTIRTERQLDAATRAALDQHGISPA